MAVNKKTFNPRALCGLMTVNILLALNMHARSQAVETGRTQFLSNCVECHGADGKGTGPLTVKLKTKPINLTGLAKRNNGVFSPEAVYKMIDGRETNSSQHRHANLGMSVFEPACGAKESSQPKAHNCAGFANGGE